MAPNPNINRRVVLKSRTSTGYDSDAQALFDAVEAEDGAYIPTYQKTATSVLIAALKIEGFDQKIIMAPFLGGNAAGAKYHIALNNSKYQGTITWGAGVNNTHFSAYGFHPDGEATCYGRSGIIPSDECESINDCGIGTHVVYDPSLYGSGNVIPIGCASGSGASANRFRILDKTSVLKRLYQIGGGFGNDYAESGSDDSMYFGIVIGNRNASNSLKGWKDGSEIGEQTTLVNDLSIVEIDYGCQNNNGSHGGSPFAGRMSFGITLLDNFSDAEILTLNGLLETWLIGMGRYV